jgi:hypothetical protein
MGQEYQYTSQAEHNRYNDGRVKYSHDFTNFNLDRFYQYDYAARLTQALSGVRLEI